MNPSQDFEKKIASEIHQKALSKMTPQQKLEQAGALHSIAWELKASGVRSQNPTWPEEKVQAAVRRIFLHGHT